MRIGPAGHIIGLLVLVFLLSLDSSTTLAQTTISKRVAASSDDAEEEGPDGTNPGAMYLISSDIELVRDFEPVICGTQKIGLRFTAMSIPAGATITDAYLTFRAIAADAPMTNSEATSLTIKGQLIADAPTFSSTSGDISSRTLTSASASWTPGSWTTGADYNSPSIASIIQEIVDQGSWASGNDIAIIITGTGHRASPSYDGDAARAALLVVSYNTVYYSKGSLAVSTVSNWNTARDGSGTNAAAFDDGHTWVIQNGHAMTLTGSTSWNVGASGTVQIENGGTWTNSSSGTVTIGTLQVDNGGTYAHGSTAAFPGTTRTLGATSTVDYSRAGNQTVTALSYGHLTLSGSGTKTMPGAALSIAGNFTTSGTVSATAASAFTVSGNVNVGSGTTFNGASYTHNVAGNFSKTGTFTASTSTINLNGTGAQDISGGPAFNNLTIANTATAVTSSASFSVGSTFTVNASATFTPGAADVISGAGTLTGSGTVKVTRTAATPDFSSQYTITNKTLINLTVDYSATAAQTISAVNYGHLTISAARTTNSVTLANSGTIGIAGIFTNSATFTSGGYVNTGSTVNYNGAGAQTVIAFNYNNLTLSTSGTKTLASGTAGIAGTLSISGTATADATTNSSTVDYNGNGAQGVGAITYHHLTLSNAGTKTFAASPITIQGNFSTSGTVIATTAAALTINGNFSTAGGTTFNAGTYTHTVKGNYAASGTMNYSSSTIVLGGTSQQTLSAPGMNNLTINNANGVVLGANSWCDGTLTFTSGKMTLGNYWYQLGAAGTISGASSSNYFVTNGTGYLQINQVTTAGRSFPVGTATSYLPATIKVNDASGTGIKVRVAGSISPAFSRDTVAVQAAWFVEYDSPWKAPLEYTFQWNASDEGASLQRQYISSWINSGSWTIHGTATVAGSNPYTATVTGVSSYGQFILAEAYSVSGAVFEDVNYGGGAGRGKASSSGVGRQYADVELYNSSGVYVSGTNTDANGDYSFRGITAGTYYVRVVVDSVRSSRTGWSTSCKPVMTYRTNAASGTAVGVTDYVGGTDPSASDPGIGSSGATFNTTTFVYSAVLSGTAQAVTQCVIGSANITGVDFGFNYNLVANTNNNGQGSLRQAITNMNTLAGDASLAQSGLVAAKDNAVFMISNGTTASGLRSANNYFSSGIATISPTSALPTVSTAVVLDAQKQPGWSSTPVIELNGTSAGSGARGLDLTGGNSVVRGFIINRFTGSANSAGVYISGTGQNTIQGNYIGTNSAGDAASANYQGIYVSGTTGNVIGGTSTTQRNVVSGNTWRGIGLYAGTSGNTVRGNYVGVNAAGTAAIANNIGVTIWDSQNNTIGGTGDNEGNVLSGNSNFGVYFVNSSFSSNGNVVQGNIIGLNAAQSGAVPNGASGIELCCAGNGGLNNTIGGTTAGAANIVSGNTGKGIVFRGGSGNGILTNSIYNNGGIGIDLNADNVTANNGTKNAGLPNYEMDFPVFTYASLTGTTLTLEGYVGSGPSQSTFANARVEVYKSDDDATGYGEGQTYLGYLTADANGNINGSIAGMTGLSSGDKITATATDGSNNTSEFGANFTISVVYYSKGNLAVSTASNWNTARDGSGTNASSFGTGNRWVIQNTHAMSLSGSTTWDVSISGTVQIESGGSWTNTSSGTVTIGALQVDNGGAYSHANANTLPGTTRSFGVTSTVNYSASANQTVVSETYGHLAISGSGTKTLAGNVTVAGDLTVVAGTLDLSSYTANRSSAGGTLSVYNGAVLKIGGTNSFPTNYNTTSLGATSTVEYNGAAQSIASKTYGHLTLSSGNTKTASAAVTVVGDLTIAATTTFDAQSYAHAVQGNWINSGTFTAGTNTVQFTGSNAANITGATTFNVLEVNKNSSSTTITLNNNVTASTLTMTQGKISTGANSVLVTSSRTGNGLVIGTITRTHTFNASTAYAFEGPYQTLTFNSGGTPPTSVTVTTVLSSPGANDYMDPIDRYYVISQTGGTGFSYTLRLHYEESEVNAPNSETSPPLKIWRRTSTGPDVWTREGSSSSNTTNNWVEQTGLSNVGTFSLSSRTVADIVLTLSQSAANPSPGDQVTYTLDYSNSGDGTSTNTVVTASAPSNTTYVANQTRLNGILKTDAADADEVTVSGSTITINLGTVAAGGSGTITYKVAVN